MTDHSGRLMAQILVEWDPGRAPAVTVLTVRCSSTGDVSPAIGGSVREFARSSCAVRSTH